MGGGGGGGKGGGRGDREREREMEAGDGGRADGNGTIASPGFIHTLSQYLGALLRTINFYLKTL